MPYLFVAIFLAAIERMKVGNVMISGYFLYKKATAL